MSEPPRAYQELRDAFPTLVDAFERLADAGHEAGPLDERTRRLLKLGIATGARLEGAVRSAARRCQDSGITEAEIDHALVLAASTIGLPATVAARDWVRDELRR